MKKVPSHDQSRLGKISLTLHFNRVQICSIVLSFGLVLALLELNSLQREHEVSRAAESSASLFKIPRFAELFDFISLWRFYLHREYAICYALKMTDYPLGSFPRFAHQEKWAQERRARAIHNSIITRQAQKLQRQREEADVMVKIIAEWNRIADSIHGKACSRELGQEFHAITRSLKRTSEGWSPDRSYSNYLKKVIARINTFSADWNLRELRS